MRISPRDFSQIIVQIVSRTIINHNCIVLSKKAGKKWAQKTRKITSILIQLIKTSNNKKNLINQGYLNVALKTAKFNQTQISMITSSNDKRISKLRSHSLFVAARLRNQLKQSHWRRISKK